MGMPLEKAANRDAVANPQVPRLLHRLREDSAGLFTRLIRSSARGAVEPTPETSMEEAQLIIGGTRCPAAKQLATFARHNPDLRRGRTTRRRRLRGRREGRRRCSRCGVPEVVQRSARASVAPCSTRPRTCWSSAPQQFATLVHGRDGRDRRLGAFQHSSRRRHAARSRGDDHADQRRSRAFGRAGQHGDGCASARGRGAGHRAVECADHSRRASRGNAAGLRQHRHPQGIGSVSGDASADRGHAARCRSGGWRHQCASRTSRRMRRRLRRR